jgi:hypothetical protein
MSNKRARYTAGEIGRIRVIDDFLPPPADLVPREDNVKVTLSLSRRSLDFFKREAKKRRVPYQRMIRALVDTYADKQAGGKKIVGWAKARMRRAHHILLRSNWWARFALPTLREREE